MINKKKFKRKWHNTLKMLSLSRSRCLIVNASMRQEQGCVMPFNIGDDLNVFLIEAISGKRVFNKKDVWNVYCLPVYMCIGSILNARWMHPRANIVWGSGARNDTDPPRRANPKRVTAVRGPKTRAMLQKFGIECPEVYGDPALLLPRYYQPKRKKTHYKLGIIPHIYDLKHSTVDSLVKQYPDEVCLIDVKHYTDWRKVIDRIVDCELIFSSSLHGLIIADAYHVPNRWISFSDTPTDGTFKFEDYMQSVQRSLQAPLPVTPDLQLKDLQRHIDEYKDIAIDLDALMHACPFL